MATGDQKAVGSAPAAGIEATNSGLPGRSRHRVSELPRGPLFRPRVRTSRWRGSSIRPSTAGCGRSGSTPRSPTPRPARDARAVSGPRSRSRCAWRSRRSCASGSSSRGVWPPSRHYPRQRPLRGAKAPLCSLVGSEVSSMPVPASPIDAVVRRFVLAERIVGRLMEWLRMASVGTDPRSARGPQGRRMVPRATQAAGFKAELRETGTPAKRGNPIVWATNEERARLQRPARALLRTYDGEPADPIERGRAGPSEPVIRPRFPAAQVSTSGAGL